MPELPEMRALAERLHDLLAGARVERVDALSFSGLKTVRPAPAELVGRRVQEVSNRGKLAIVACEGGIRLLFHLGQSGRVHLESAPAATRPRDGVVRLVTEACPGILVRERSKEHTSAWWVLAPGDDGPLSRLGPDPFSAAAAELVRLSTARRQLHGWLRDQHVIAGIGRGYADDILHAAKLSPFATIANLGNEERERLVAAISAVLSGALTRERARTGALEEADLGDRFLVHRRAGRDCPTCGGLLERVAFASSEIAYCPHCQCNGRVLADRRLSRLLR